MWQPVQDLPESFRRGETSTRDLAQVKGAEIQQVQMSRKLGRSRQSETAASELAQ
ncbi:hypothetical protein QEA29_002531 [Salmonella enterica]|nr:hypothetical protein [Salmonella enterica]EKT1324363.1 hypothetical protein [Salmonella enterica]EKT1357459.1 hypothetical protein [Salmonella enterica]EKT2633790.1 hypothetical protein [Salmonella enterica]EKT3329059.1 hypothetical protein [Salmonella enterica]